MALLVSRPHCDLAVQQPLSPATPQIHAGPARKSDVQSRTGPIWENPWSHVLPHRPVLRAANVGGRGAAVRVLEVRWSHHCQSPHRASPLSDSTIFPTSYRAMHDALDVVEGGPVAQTSDRTGRSRGRGLAHDSTYVATDGLAENSSFA